MKTRVNLYAPEFHPKLRLMTLTLTLACCGFVLLLVVAGWMHALYQQQGLEQELKLSQQQKSQQANVVSALQNELTTQQKDPRWQREMDQNLQTLALKNQVLQELLKQESLKTNGFAKLMNELAEHHQSGLWLKHISLDGHYVQLEGAAIESSLVPKWIKQLGATAYFKGQEFAETRLYRNDEQLHFVITSAKQADGAEAQNTRSANE